MNKKYKFSIILLAIASMTMLTGCNVSILSNTNMTINQDNGSKVESIIGLDTESIEAIKSADMEVQDNLVKYDYNDKSYMVYNESFHVVDNINHFGSRMPVVSGLYLTIEEVIGGNSEMDDGAVADYLIYTFDIPTNYEETNGIDISDEYQAELGIEELEVISNFVLCNDAGIEHIGGETHDVLEVTDTHVRFDILKYMQADKEAGTLEELEDGTPTAKISFKVNKYADTTDEYIYNFDDVQLGSWYYKAVCDMANKGLISGYGDNKFRPNDVITVAEFAQILNNVYSLPGRDFNGDALVTIMTSEGEILSDYSINVIQYNPVEPKPDEEIDSNYWASEAIHRLISLGAIEDRGVINSKNYDTPITREEAIYAISCLLDNKNIVISEDNLVRGDDIPDIDQIALKYSGRIIRAYNSGITSGVDSNKTFNPKANLTRAEICQLLYKY